MLPRAVDPAPPVEEFVRPFLRSGPGVDHYEVPYGFGGGNGEAVSGEQGRVEEQESNGGDGQREYED